MKLYFYFIPFFLFSHAAYTQTDTTIEKKTVVLPINAETSGKDEKNSESSFSRGICVSFNFLPSNIIGKQKNGIPKYIEEPHQTFPYGLLDFALQPPTQPFLGYYTKQGGNSQMLELTYISLKRELDVSTLLPITLYGIRYTYNYVSNKNTKLKLNYNMAGVISANGSDIKYKHISADGTGLTSTTWTLKNYGLLFQISPNLVYRMKRLNFMLAANLNLFSLINENYKYDKYYQSTPPYPLIGTHIDLDHIVNKKTYFRWASDFIKSDIIYHSMCFRMGYDF